MEKLTVSMIYKRAVIYFEEGSIDSENFKQVDDFIKAQFIIPNGAFDEVFDDTEDDEVKASKISVKIHNIGIDEAVFDIEAEFIFNVDEKLTTKDLLEWQDENDLFSFGFSVFVNPEFIEDEMEAPSVELFDDFLIAVVK